MDSAWGWSYYTDSHENGGERVIKLPAGTYTFTVSGNGFYTGAASFRLLDLDAAAPVTLRQTVAGELAPQTETNMYSFPATAGQRFFFRALSDPRRPSPLRKRRPTLRPQRSRAMRKLAS